MGVRANGQSIMGVPGGGEERKGLGTSRPEDVYLLRFFKLNSIDIFVI